MLGGWSLVNIVGRFFCFKGESHVTMAVEERLVNCAHLVLKWFSIEGVDCKIQTKFVGDVLHPLQKRFSHLWIDVSF